MNFTPIRRRTRAQKASACVSSINASSETVTATTSFDFSSSSCHFDDKKALKIYYINNTADSQLTISIDSSRLERL